jgi:hypothetical protein
LGALSLAPSGVLTCRPFVVNVVRKNGSCALDLTYRLNAALLHNVSLMEPVPGMNNIVEQQVKMLLKKINVRCDI